MKTLFHIFFALLLALGISGCFAEKNYVGKVDVVAIGAGPKPASVENKQYIEASKLPDVVVTYTPNIKNAEKTDDLTKSVLGENTKYVLGDDISKFFIGEPELLVRYLNTYNTIDNKVLILDKNGVVAWSGSFDTKGDDINKKEGIYDYGLTGRDYITFQEAMEKFVIDGEEAATYDAEKEIKFPRNLKEGLLAGFSYSKSHPFLFTKLPDMQLQTADGKTVNLSKYVNDGKPTVLMFFMASKKSGTLKDDLNKVKDITSMFTGGSGGTKRVSPEEALKQIEQTYFKRQY